MIRLLVLLSAVVGPVLVTTSIIDGQNKSAQGLKHPTARRSQNVEIVPSHIADSGMIPTIPQEQIISVLTTPEPALKQLVIDRCDGRVGNANFRSRPSMTSQSQDVDPNIVTVIPQYSVVEVTGQSSGQWMEVVYGGVGGWINQCWQ